MDESVFGFPLVVSDAIPEDTMIFIDEVTEFTDEEKEQIVQTTSLIHEAGHPGVWRYRMEIDPTSLRKHLENRKITIVTGMSVSGPE